MTDEAKTREQLIWELVVLRRRTSDLELSDKQHKQLQQELALVDEVARILTSTLNIE